MGLSYQNHIYSVYTILLMLVRKIRIEGPIVKEVTRSGHGGHVIVPEDWIGKTVRVMIIDDGKQAAEEKIKTKQDLKNEYAKFKRHLRGAARLARKNVNLSESESADK